MTGTGVARPALEDPRTVGCRIGMAHFGALRQEPCRSLLVDYNGMAALERTPVVGKGWLQQTVAVLEILSVKRTWNGEGSWVGSGKAAEVSYCSSLGRHSWGAQELRQASRGVQRTGMVAQDKYFQSLATD